MAPIPKIESPTDMAAFLKDIDVVLFDQDGVIWTGDKLTSPDVPAAIEYLRSLGKQIYFVSNNSTKSRAMTLAKFEGKGIKASKDEIINSAFAAARYLAVDIKLQDSKKPKVWVIGEQGPRDELTEFKMKVVDPSVVDGKPFGDMEHIEIDPEIGAVLVGFDRDFDYPRLAYACHHLREGDGVLFVATNTDAANPSSTPGRLMPAGGTMVTAVEVGCGRAPDKLAGKPTNYILDIVKEDSGVADPSRFVMFGDRLDTDMLFARTGGIKACLVSTGVNTYEEASSLTGEMLDREPTHYMDCIADMLKAKDA